MSSEAAQFLDGARVASVAVSVDEATPRGRLLAGQAEEAANSEDPQLALVASEPVAVASVEASADEVVAVVALVADSGVIEEASVADEEASVAAVEVTSVVVAEVSATSPTAMDLPMALQLVLAVHEVVALAATEEAEVDSEATAVEAEDDTKTDAAAVVVATTEDPAALTTNRSAAEIDTATATVGTVVEAETTAQGSAATKATATTTEASAADTRPARWLTYLLQGFVKGYLPFLRLTLSRL